MSDVEVGPPIVKAASNQRSYKLIKLRNGLAALLIHDPEVSLDEEAEDDDDTDDMEIDAGCPSEQPEDQEWSSDFQNNCRGVGGIDLNVDTRPCLRFHPDEEGNTKSSIFSSLKKDKEFDPSSTKKAAAAMCVGVGSMADPEDAPGLAHFLVVGILHKGAAATDKYDKFLSQHGGSSNAYTDQEFTCYHFEVINKCFRDALERFSQFFISPLVKVEAMDREIQAIESEFVLALANDGNRLSQVQCHTALPSHPMHRFSWGNRKSLGEPMERGVDMRGKLLQLYHDHYRAGRMKLVLLGGESIETLQKWVVELFSGVREGGHGRLMFHCEGRIWEPHRFYLIAAGQEQSLVSVTWPLPCLESAYLKKPQDYFGHLIGHEGAGSLQALLKKKGWGRTVMAGCGDNGHETNSVTFNFTVTISLTSHGLQHVMEVIGLLYQYLKMLRSVGPQEWVFKEQKAVSTLNFQFPEEGASDEYAISLATNMHLYSEAHIMYGEYAHDLWDPSLITSLLARLTSENMRLDLLLHSFDKNTPGVQIEPWFETPFKEETLPANTMKIWANPPSVDPALHMPVHNEFIPLTLGGSEVVDGAAARPEEEEVVDDHGTSDGPKSDEAEVRVDNELPVSAGSETTQQVSEFQPASEMGILNEEKKVAVQVQTEKDRPQEQQQIGSKDQPLRKPDKLVACPRCDSLDTKFCYYNNYNINQPRHFCKSCQRYWTAGGTLRNVLVGAGRRKNKYGGLQPRQVISENSALTTVRVNYYDSAQQPLPCPSSSSGSPVAVHTSNVKAAQSTRPSISSQCSPLSVLELPGVRSASTPSPCKEGAARNIVSSGFTVHRAVPAAQKVYTSGSAFKVAGADLTLETISKVRTRSKTDTTETRDDCASSTVNASGESALAGNVKLPQQPDASAWTHPAAPLGFFNGAWPYGYNVGWSGMGLMPSAASFCPPPQAPAMGSGTPPLSTQMWSGPPGGVWTGIWAAGMAQPGLAMSAMPFGWNMQQSGWTMPWRPVAHMAVQASAQESGDPNLRCTGN